MVKNILVKLGVFIIVYVTFFSVSFAQLGRANKYFEQGSYSDAIIYYEKVLKKVAVAFEGYYLLAAVICDSNNPLSQKLVVGKTTSPDDYNASDLETTVYQGDDWIGEFVFGENNSDYINFKYPDYNSSGEFMGYKYIELIPSGQTALGTTLLFG